MFLPLSPQNTTKSESMILTDDGIGIYSLFGGIVLIVLLTLTVILHIITWQVAFICTCTMLGCMYLYDVLDVDLASFIRCTWASVCVCVFVCGSE